MGTRLFNFFEVIIEIDALNGQALIGFLDGFYGSIVEDIIRFHAVVDYFTYPNFSDQIKDDSTFLCFFIDNYGCHMEDISGKVIKKKSY